MKIVTYYSTNAPTARCWIAHLFTVTKTENRDKSEPNTTNDPWGWVPITFFGASEDEARQKAIGCWQENEAVRKQKIAERKERAEAKAKREAEKELQS